MAPGKLHLRGEIGAFIIKIKKTGAVKNLCILQLVKVLAWWNCEKSFPAGNAMTVKTDFICLLAFHFA